MRKIKRAYFYIFYKFYKLSESAPSSWMSDWKAGLVVDVLLLFLFSSAVNYYKVFFDHQTHFGEGNLLLIIVLLIGGLNYFIFHHKEKWREIKEFDELPKKKNKIGSWMVFGGATLIFFNFIFSFYLFYQLKK